MPIARPVVDTIGLLPAHGVSRIELALRKLRSATRVQMAVLIVRTTRGEPIEQFALRQARAWGGGDRGVDQGVLLVIAMGDRRMRLEVGYGLQGTLTEQVSRKILDVAGPAMRAGDHTGAIALIVDNVGRRVQGIALHEPQPAAGVQTNEIDPVAAALRAERLSYLLILLVVGALLGVCCCVALRRLRKRMRAGWRHLLVWGSAVGLSLTSSLFAPDGFVFASWVGHLGMVPIGYLWARGVRGSVLGTILMALALAGILFVLLRYAVSDKAELSPMSYALNPLVWAVLSLFAFVVLTFVSLVLLILAMLAAVIEARLRNIRWANAWTLHACSYLYASLFKAIAGDPEFEVGGGSSGGTSPSYSSASSYSSSSSSSSSSSDSGRSGGGGGFGGGGGSSSS